MTGDEFWTVAGFLAVVLGIVLIRFWRRKAPTAIEREVEKNEPQDDQAPNP